MEESNERHEAGKNPASLEFVGTEEATEARVTAGELCRVCRAPDPPVVVSAATLTTEWVGCDCGFWFHIVCVRLHSSKMRSYIDEFSCNCVGFQCQT